MVERGDLSSTVARGLLEEIAREGGDPESLVVERGLAQVSDTSVLESLVADVIAGHPDEVQRYQDGNKRLIGFFIGQVMQATKGQANAGLCRELLQKKLG